MERLLAGRYRAVWGFAVIKGAGGDRRSGANWVNVSFGGERCALMVFPQDLLNFVFSCV